MRHIVIVSPTLVAWALMAAHRVLADALRSVQGRVSSSLWASTSQPSAWHDFTTSAALERIRRTTEYVERPHEEIVRPEKPELVEQFFDPSLGSTAEKTRDRMRQARQEIERFSGDTGSPEVQVSALSVKIAAVSQHMRTHRKDFHSRLGLEGMLMRRRKLLQYLRRKDFDSYSLLLARLGLKDSYTKQDRLTKYKIGGTGTT